MNAELIGYAKIRLDEEVAKALNDGGKEAAIAYIDGLLEHHAKECDEKCEGGRILREARAKLVNPLSSAELSSLGIEPPPVEQLPSTVSPEAKSDGEFLAALTEKDVHIIEGTNEGEGMTAREKMFFLVGYGTRHKDRDRAVSIMIKEGLIRDATDSELLPYLITTMKWLESNLAPKA